MLEGASPDCEAPGCELLACELSEGERPNGEADAWEAVVGVAADCESFPAFPNSFPRQSNRSFFDVTMPPTNNTMTDTASMRKIQRTA